jgi:predicted enzyme related to lactoylglutathione lyase
MTVRWATGFLDFPAATFDQGCSFWQAVTGYTLSPPRGESGQFATLQPPLGEPYLRVQRTGSTRPRCHLDLHVDDVEATARRAKTLGAQVAQDRKSLVLMGSPAGLPFCLVGAGRDMVFVRPPPKSWPGEHRSLVDQACLDILPEYFPGEAAFWEALTGWERRPGSRPEFEYLVRPSEMPVRLLLQRLGDDTGPGTGGIHLDLACDDVAAETIRHQSLGAVVVTEPSWTTLRDPTGLLYCITRRDPATGVLGKA